MGQKVNPIAFRLSQVKNWQSKWFANKRRYKELLLEDIQIRDKIMSNLRHAGVANVEIERSVNQITINIHVSRPGIVIGRSGTGIEEIKKNLEKFINQKLKINVIEIKNPDLSAFLVARSIADQIEKRFPIKRVMARTAERVKSAGAVGVKIVCSGRIDGAEIARREKLVIGSVPLQTLRSNIDFAVVPAKTVTAGVVGVKVWINKGKKETN
ncbi:MAG: 30S ribosomal protein S3 [Candidatus Woykebacteria bacterium RIFCSPHIGHO2_01_FULL_39_12]|uniref:Small ribosomal subunit protein uS3 n=2 Tax=Candidatus Woykeibacteriota TaxID=1817899 RepID=A0A1G1WDM4_9BACT|nr:MAG: 30S ribosomal protein S3 [Candidatus Woykebacteria bacterium RBG_16_39_9b]OGY27156.1 MAG: 30S ribosomal protein S3 [Candidatus Woykebacteria bacterium RIFCSPHIGHO2_01_FULL_39_12]